MGCANQLHHSGKKNCCLPQEICPIQCFCAAHCEACLSSTAHQDGIRLKEPFLHLVDRQGGTRARLPAPIIEHRTSVRSGSGLLLPYSMILRKRPVGRNLNSSHTRLGEQCPIVSRTGPAIDLMEQRKHSEQPRKASSHVILYTDAYFHHARRSLILCVYLHRQQPCLLFDLGD